jgi:hypothetical protein
MPRASEKASAMAMISMPLTTTSLDLVPECSPTINPRVVIMAEVKPKLSPVFIECLGIIYLRDRKLAIERLLYGL